VEADACGILFIIYTLDAADLFDFLRTDREISLDLVGFVHYNLKVQDILIERFDRSLDDVILCNLSPVCPRPDSRRHPLHAFGF
jgi:hypothetical protein